MSYPNGQRKGHNLLGGANPETVWSNHIDQSIFRDRLIKDVSLKNVGAVNADGSINQDIVKRIFLESDPTENKKYFTWILDGYRDGGNHLLEDIKTHMNLSLRKFTSLKDQHVITGAESNILDFCGLFGCQRKNKNQIGLLTVLEKFKATSTLTTEQRRSVKKGGEKVFEDDDIIVIHPINESAATLYGKGTMWCTSAEENNMFNQYNEKGSLYIIIPKHSTGEKYQLHLQSGSFMNEMDREISNEDYQRHKESFVNFLRTLDLKGLDLSEIKDNIVLVNALIHTENPHIINQHGETLLHLMGIDEESVEILLRNGINPNSKDSEGKTPLYFHYNPKIIKLLVKAGGNPNIQDKMGRTPLHTQNMGITRLTAFLNEGANPFIVDKSGMTLLHFDTYDVKAVELLLLAGLDPNARDNMGKTPSDYATHPSVIMTLFKASIDPTM
jgi:hypothetical protein